MTGEGVLRIPFSLRGLAGQVDVAVSANSEPDALGYSLLTGGEPADFARGFPVCRATVRYPADGYAAVFGWTQLVRSTDAATAGFEMDPIAVYAAITTPFAWFGLRPELFDAPSRESEGDLDWEAHSFLCALPDAVLSRTVQAVTGFRWGFARRGGQFTFAAPGGPGGASLERAPGLAPLGVRGLGVRARLRRLGQGRLTVSAFAAARALAAR